MTCSALAFEAPTGFEEICPRGDLGVVFEQGSPLAFGQAAPDAEFDLVVESVGKAFQRDRAPTTHRGRLFLSPASNEHVFRLA